MSFLDHYYRGVGKLSKHDAFKQKVTEAKEIPEMSILHDLCVQIRLELNEYLTDMEIIFGSITGPVVIKSKVVNGHKTNKEVRVVYKIGIFRKSVRANRVFNFLQLSRLWRLTTTSICTVLMFDGKHRVGTVQHFMVDEFEAAKRGGDQEGAVFWVQKHKLGEKKPSTMIVDDELLEFMDR